MRGEAETGSGRAPARGGRSPRARGSPFTLCAEILTPRSIPACAGKPRDLAQFSSPCGVDPRVRGEAGLACLIVSGFAGRSPRARGSRVPLTRTTAHVGSIPACAGKPGIRLRRVRLVRVDPRVRGEAHGLPQGLPHGLGRSPRARGSPMYVLTCPAPSGSIPACAGKPLDANLLRVERKPYF